MLIFFESVNTSVNANRVSPGCSQDRGTTVYVFYAMVEYNTIRQITLNTIILCRICSKTVSLCRFISLRINVFAHAYRKHTTTFVVLFQFK